MGPDYLEAMKLIPQRRYDEAASLLIEICRANPGVGEPWTVLALCLLCLERYADLQDIIELRQRQAGDGLRLFNDSLGVALERSEHAAIRNVLAAVPSDSALTVVARYWAGLVAALDGEADRGIGLIHEAARLISALPPNLAQESFIATIATEACLLEPSTIVAEIEQADPQKLLAVFPGVAATLTPVIVPRDAATESFVFLSSCDQRYLEKFGETVVRALDATRARTVYHLHVIDPSPDVASIVARLQAGCSSLTLGYSTEAYGGADQGYSRAEFYACGRLIRLPEIFALYDRDVFMWDVDTNAVNDFALVVAAMKGVDLGYFQMKNTRLTLVSHLATVFFANTPATQRLGRIIRNYILAKFPTSPFWLLDQASVYCAEKFLAGADPNFRFRDFAVTGRDFAAAVDVASSAEEKQSMRKAAT
ncbi:MAG TPA: hypothetical protein VHX19_10935 [Stellaceae bacterium]|nr:hypothetical protein [Stellaceae bacterium]